MINWEIIQGPDGPEPHWLSEERNLMLQEVNSLRRDIGLPEVGYEDMVRIETAASGHSDYPDKFVLYCTELVIHGSSGN